MAAGDPDSMEHRCGEMNEVEHEKARKQCRKQAELENGDERNKREQARREIEPWESQHFSPAEAAKSSSVSISLIPGDAQANKRPIRL